MSRTFLPVIVCLFWAGLSASTSAQAYYAYIPTDLASVSIVDTVSHQVIGTVPVGNRPLGVAVSPDGSTVLITNNTDGTVSVIDTATETVSKTITVGSLANAVVFAPDGAHAYVVNGGPSTVSVIDLSTDTVTATVRLISRYGSGAAEGSEAAAISPDGTHLYVDNVNDESVSVIDTATNKQVAAVNVHINGEMTFGDYAAIGVSPDGTTVFASDATGFSVISTATNTVSQVFDLTTPMFADVPGAISSPMGASLSGVTFSPDGKHAYANSSLQGGVYVFSLPDLTYERFIKVTYFSNEPNGISLGDALVALAPDGKKLFNVGFGAATEIDVATGLVEAAFPVPNATIALGAFAVTPTSPIVSAILPGGRSVTTSTTATVFSTLLNTSSTVLANCSIALPSGTVDGITMHYQSTDPATNLPVGQQDVPVTIPANGASTFVLSFRGATALSTLTQQLVYSCSGTPTTTVVTGVNTVDLLFSASPVTDIIALSATLSGDGIVTVPLSGSAEAPFTLATYNNGAAGLIIASVDTGGVVLPVTATICQSDPVTAQCLAPAASSISVGFPANSIPTFSVFVKASGSVPFAPASSRLFVRFNDSSGVSHGVTSVAVQTSN